MKIHDILPLLNETSYFDPGLERHLNLKKLGYQKLGRGRDQQAWAHPDGAHVLKIFGTHQRGQGGMTEDQKMFKFWVDYCQQNSAKNPYLPIFSSVDAVEYPPGSGQQYLQAVMERLTPITQPVISDLLTQFEISVTSGRDWPQFKKIVASRLGAKFVQTSPLFKTSLLWDTVSELYTIADSKGWEIDLDGPNYMQRAGGQLVIVDPWLAS